MTTCPDNRLWDAFVLRLPGTDINQMTAHLESCPDCQVVLADRQAFYAGLGVLAAGEPAARKVPVAEPVFCRPMNLIDLPRWTESVMAAAGTTDVPAPIALTFVSEDRRWIVRVVRDAGSGHLRLYLLSNTGEAVDGVLVRLSNVGEPFLTDSSGSADLGSLRWPAGSDPRVSVSSPAATFSLGPLDHLEQSGTGTFVQSPHGDTLKVSFEHVNQSRTLRLEIVNLSPDLTGRPLHVAIRSTTKDRVVALEPVMVIDNFESLGSLEIYLFP